MTYLVQRLKHGVHFFQDCGNGVQAQEPLDDIMVDEGDLVRQAKDCLPFRRRTVFKMKVFSWSRPIFGEIEPLLLHKQNILIPLPLKRP